MALSKSTRILILIGINAAFFLLELIVGSAVNSLALVADSFHMLNDVLSLFVGLWAVKAANSSASSKMYTYGWQRAEILGGLLNGVFLVALCLSIFLDAVQRFFQPQVVHSPMLVLIVGCCGLLFNVAGLFLFHDHGHSHDSQGHSHGAIDQAMAAEEGTHQRQASGTDAETYTVADEGGNVADVLPQAAVGIWPGSQTLGASAREGSSERARRQYTKSDENDSTAANSTLNKSTSPLSLRKSNASSTQQRRHRRRQNSGSSRSRFASIDDLKIHPASFRNDIIAASRLEDIESQAGSGSDREDAVSEHSAHENSPLLKPKTAPSHSYVNGYVQNGNPEDCLHARHKHSQPKDPATGGGAHSHSDLNMRGVFLHVMGDALGNIGVIISALIIWLTTWSGRYYADPAISLIITVVILTSAIPLCKAASKILLQAVPVGIDVDDIKYDIEEIPGIISCHHLHVWQLSNVKYIASLHVQLEVDFKGEGAAGYMKIASSIRHCLNGYGIKSSTIQPEFCLDSEHNHTSGNASDHEGGGDDGGGGTPRPKSKGGSKAASLRNGAPDACLLDCGTECGEEGQCCPPALVKGSGSGDAA